MSQSDLIPDLNWLAASSEVDDAWLGPGPKLLHLDDWIEQLAEQGHHTLVSATYAAAKAASQHWEQWLTIPNNEAMESLCAAKPPPEQLAAVARWLESPTAEYEKLALKTTDPTKQLYWFHEEYRDVWFDLPGMWAIDSSEYCVLTLTGDPYGRIPLNELAAISIMCAVNSFRRSMEDDIRQSLAVVIEAVRRQFGK